MLELDHVLVKGFGKNVDNGISFACRVRSSKSWNVKKGKEAEWESEEKTCSRGIYDRNEWCIACP